MRSLTPGAPYAVEPGAVHPLGARVDRGGVNFSVFSQHATRVELCLFDRHDSAAPVQVIPLDPRTNRTFYFWHCYVRGLKAGAHYGYRVDGPRDPRAGHRFDPKKLLVDPYAFGNTTHLWDRVAACGEADNLTCSMRSVVIDPSRYDWEGDRPPGHAMCDSIIYELNVGGFTRSPTSGVRARGKFAGLIEKIPYLRQLGVTAVELLPVMDFDEGECLRETADGRRLTNFWGYSTIGFFAPDASYCQQPHEGAHLDEFRDLVKALHRAGIEVILDVVFNHTNEGNHQGPTISFKGLDNAVFYHLVPNAPQYYMDYSGCGNTLNCNHPVVAKLILECLEFWVRDMHVDGFRFDEGSVLSRLLGGAPSPMAPALWNIELSEELADTKLIAEAWDAAGLYQIGSFPGFRWAEWNGRYRDDVRRFVAGQPGLVGALATRLAGSADLYEGAGRRPINSINLITCHDGFTLNDLVSYDRKHNEANGEGSRDGIDENLSWNCGHEGPSEDAAVEALRSRQCKNFSAILLLSQGVPMVLGGDEMRRTQQGNNNAYCQDNELSWVDWSRLERHGDVARFFQKMIAFRKAHRCLRRGQFFGAAVNDRGLPEVAWHGCRLGAPGWSDPASRVLAMTLGGDGGEEDLFAIFNMEEAPLPFELPAVPGRAWHVAVDTARPSPEDAWEPGTEPAVAGPAYRASGRSVVVLVSR